MQEVIRYRCEDGQEFETIESALKHEYILAMHEYGFSSETAKKILDKSDHIQYTINNYNGRLERIRLEKTV